MDIYITDHGTRRLDGNNVGGTFWNTDRDTASKAHDEAVKKYAGKGYVKTYRVSLDEVVGLFLESGFPEQGIDEPIWIG